MGIYETLGVKTIINGWGTVTRVGGSLMHPEVLRAMEEASRHYVEVSAMHKAAGEHIARLLGVEACCITCGAAAGIAVTAAACMTRGNRAKALQLPDTTGMQDEALILKCHRTLYDQAMLLSGIKMREVGTTSFCCPEQVEAAAGERTALFFYAAEAEPMRGSIPLETLMPMLRRRGIPVVVDAAAEVPPKSNITKHLDMGADMVLFSGGKELRGPQSSGLILGKREWVEACEQNACPNYSIGRAMKIDKETIAGIVRAVELFVEKDYDQEVRRWEKLVTGIADKLADHPHAQVRLGYPTEPGIQPADLLRAYVRPLRKTAQQLHDELCGLPVPVFTGLSGDELAVNAQCLDAEDAAPLVESFRRLL